MSAFEELALPAEETSSAVYRGMWFVTIKNLTTTNSGILTTDGSGIWQAAMGGNHAKFYFDSELQAFSVSSLYYFNHNMLYPYVSEWTTAQKNEFNNSVPVGAGTLSESEVMEFI